MKTALNLITFSLFAFAFASCCGFDNNYSCGHETKTKTVTTYKEEVVTVNPGGKGGMPYTKVVKVPHTKQYTSKEKCKCTDKYCPRPDCCGKISQEVLSRASVQGGTGDPFLGLIPTMKPLVTLEN